MTRYHMVLAIKICPHSKMVSRLKSLITLFWPDGPFLGRLEIDFSWHPLRSFFFEFFIYFSRFAYFCWSKLCVILVLRKHFISLPPASLGPELTYCNVHVFIKNFDSKFLGVWKSLHRLFFFLNYFQILGFESLHHCFSSLHWCRRNLQENDFLKTFGFWSLYGKNLLSDVYFFLRLFFKFMDFNLFLLIEKLI